MEIALIFYCSTLNVKKQVSCKLLIHLIIISSYDEGITNYVHASITIFEINNSETWFSNRFFELTTFKITSREHIVVREIDVPALVRMPFG
jgi:hypothetical protein